MPGKRVDPGKLIRGLVSDISVGSKLASDPRIGKVLSENIDAIASTNPALAARVKAGDPEASLEAYRLVIANSGRVPTRSFEVPIPKTPKPSAPAVTPAQAPAATPVQAIADQFDSAVGMQPQGLELGSPLWKEMSRSAGAYDNILKGRTANLRNQNPELVRVRGDAMRTKNLRAAGQRTNNPSFDARNLAAGVGKSPTARAVAGAAGLGAAAGLALRNPPKEPSSAADLVEEQRPAPKVYTSPEPTLLSQMPSTDMMLADVSPPAAPPDYSAQAKALIDKLNAMRRAAGGEVPEAPAMMKEIQRLLDMSNKQRNAPSYKPRLESGDPGEEAIALLQDLNRRREEAGGEVPDSAAVLRRVAQLQAESDRRKWGK